MYKTNKLKKTILSSVIASIVLLSGCGGGDEGGGTTDTGGGDQTSNTRVILKTGDLQDGGQGVTRATTKSGDTVSFSSLPGVLWEDSTTSMGANYGGTLMTFAAAKSYCTNLTIDGKTWRLPTRYEIFQVIDYGDVDSRLTDGIFTNYNSDFFWTSYELSNGTEAIAVNFNDGNDYARSKTSSSDNYVRCISASATSAGNFTRSTAGTTVSDSTTNLMWQDDFSTNTQTQKNRADAFTYCNDSTLEDYTNWRLPTINELHTIVDYSNNLTAFTTTATEDGIGKKYFWSSTKSQDDVVGEFKYISFTDLVTDGNRDQTEVADIRCVRNK